MRVHGLTNQGQVAYELNCQVMIRTGTNDDISSFASLQVIFSRNCSLPCVSSGSGIWISKTAKIPGEPGCYETQKQMVQALSELYTKPVWVQQSLPAWAVHWPPQTRAISTSHSAFSAPGYPTSPLVSKTHYLMRGTGWGP